MCLQLEPLIIYQLFYKNTKIHWRNTAAPNPLCVSLCPSCPMSQSYLTFPLSLFVCHMQLVSQSQFERSPRSGACEVRGENNAALLADVSNTTQNTAAVRVRRQSSSYLDILTLREAVWTVHRFSCQELQMCSRLSVITAATHASR